MYKKLKERLAALRSEDGFTLTELLVVIMIIGILLAIAIPAYLGFRERGEEAAAQSNVRAAVPAVETYYADNGTYATMTLAGLQAIDAAVPAIGITVAAATPDTYCIEFTEGSVTARKNGPDAQVEVAAC